MDTMLERVVQAIRDTDLDCNNWPHEVLMELATAAVKAMREPTDDMVQTARRAAPYDRDALEVWHDMINAALASQ